MLAMKLRWSECVPIRMSSLVASGQRPATIIEELTRGMNAAIRLRANARLTKPNLQRSGTFCSLRGGSDVAVY